MKEMRKAVRVVCFGVLLYLFLFNILQLGTLFIPAADLSGGHSMDADADSISAVLITVILTISVLSAFLYYFLKDRRYSLYEGGLINAMIRPVRRMRAGSFVSYFGLVILVQFCFRYVAVVMELLVNLFGRTTLYSEALYSDVTQTVWEILYAAVLAPLAEEIVYRGFVTKGLERFGKLFAIVSGALIFGMMHGDLGQSIFAFFVGLLFGYVALEYGLRWSILLHVANNAVLGVGFDLLCGGLSPDLHDFLLLQILLIGSAVGLIYLILRRKKILAYFRENRTAPGIWRMLWNRWFILFAILEFAMMYYVLDPLPVAA